MSHFQPNQRSSTLFDFKFIEDRRNRGEFISTSSYSKAINYEAKHGNYELGATLFDYLQAILKQRAERGYIQADIQAFQSAVSTLVRYAPSGSRGRYFLGTVLSKYDRPLRDETLEITLITNLLYVYLQVHDKRSMEDALSLLEATLETNVFTIEFSVPNNPHFNYPAEVFENIAIKVAKYHQLELNQDKTALTPILPATRQFSR